MRLRKRLRQSRKRSIGGTVPSNFNLLVGTTGNSQLVAGTSSNTNVVVGVSR